ncbi:P27 family phage terminase small subunit [Macrococcus bovicus]|uniref:P27 family phage terminase small subunit n=1 Tax=Macrococcus bovicus TaxID=69968 RepID=UPI001FB59205|nr:P27 family phage terminase small subunit [Macrococcus bovicus]
MTVAISRLREQLEEHIDIDDYQQVEKVERYIELVKMFRKIKAQVNKDGPVVKTVNGSQTFTKSHPLLADMTRINTSLLAIEKTIYTTRNTQDEDIVDSKVTYKSDDLL